MQESLRLSVKIGRTKMKSKIGSDFEDFLKEEGILEECTQKALESITKGPSKYIKTIRDLNFVRSFKDSPSSFDDKAIEKFFKEKTYYLTEDKKHLLDVNSASWRKSYGKLLPVTGDKILKKHSLSVLNECSEKNVVRLEE